MDLDRNIGDCRKAQKTRLVTSQKYEVGYWGATCKYYALCPVRIVVHQTVLYMSVSTRKLWLCSCMVCIAEHIHIRNSCYMYLESDGNSSYRECTTIQSHRTLEHAYMILSQCLISYASETCHVLSPVLFDNPFFNSLKFT